MGLFSSLVFVVAKTPPFRWHDDTDDARFGSDDHGKSHLYTCVSRLGKSIFVREIAFQTALTRRAFRTLSHAQTSRRYYESLGENIAAAVRASVPFELKFGCADSFFRYASLLVLHRESCSRASLAFCCWLKKSIHARQDCLPRRGTVSAFPSFLLRVLKRALRATQSTLET